MYPLKLEFHIVKLRLRGVYIFYFLFFFIKNIGEVVLTCTTFNVTNKNIKSFPMMFFFYFTAQKIKSLFIARASFRNGLILLFHFQLSMAQLVL